MFRILTRAAVAAVMLLVVCIPGFAQSQESIWRTPVNAIAGPNSLAKTGGCDGCYDAGAASKVEVESGDAYVDFRFPDTNGLSRAGFAHSFNVYDGHSQEFAIRVQGSFAEVREKGIFRTDVYAPNGSTFRIAIHNGVATYSENGVPFYTSSEPVVYPFVVGVILGNANTSVDSVTLNTSNPPGGGDSGGSGGNGGSGSGGGSTGGTGGGTGGGSGGVVGSQPAMWSSMAHVTLEGASVRKVNGCDGCFDAFVHSSQALDATGYIQFTANDTSDLVLAGLAHNFTAGDGMSIDCGIRIQGGYAEVRENGIYRGDISAQPGAVFRISLSGGVVSYSKDGFVFYSGPAGPGLFSFDALFANLNASISNALISDGS
jgi:hypothetical protein